MLASALLLSCLPAGTAWLCWRHPQFFDRPLAGSGQGTNSRALLAFTVVGVLVAVPAAMMLYASGAHVALLGGCALSAFAALWGASRAFGRWGAAAAAVLAGLAWLAGPLALVAQNALSVSAGAGGAHLLKGVLTRRAAVVFMVAFAALDIVIVGGGLASAAVAGLPLAGSFAEAAQHAPLFNHVKLGGSLLGTGDITYAALLGALMGTAQLSRRRVGGVCAVYLAATVAMVGAGLATGLAMPATIPGALALGALAAVGGLRAGEPARECAV